jgi:conserved hypothetical protein, YfiH family
MIRVERENVTFYRFPGLSRFPELNHFVSGREGGVSTEGRFSLNLGFMDEDSTGNVRVNRELLANAVGCSLDAFTLGEQKHTTHIEVVDTTKRGMGGKEKESRLPATDGLITREPGICLMVLAADCVPVLLYDPVERVIAAVHAGWRGTVGRIATRAVQRMGEEFHCQPENVVVGIGPSIGPCCFEVGEEVIEAAREGLGDIRGLVTNSGNPGKYYFNLWEANRRQLEQAGVLPARIEIAGVCTVCHHDRFFSYRGDHGDTGRFGAGIMLKE